MAREHHCPNCGAQACNASTSKIHTCGVCAAIWEEDLSIPTPAPVPPKPAAPAPAAGAAAAPKPTAPSPAPAATVPPAKPSAPPTPPPSAPKPPASAPVPAAGTAMPPATAVPRKPLTEVLAGAKVKRCPKCTSDGLAQPSDYRMAQGRLILVDSQTYRGHEWYADTGDLVATAAAPAAAASPRPAT